MPEMTWTTSLAWCGVTTSALTVAGVILSLVVGWNPPEAWPALSIDQVTLGQTLQRMECHAEARHQAREEPRC